MHYFGLTHIICQHNCDCIPSESSKTISIRSYCSLRSLTIVILQQHWHPRIYRAILLRTHKKKSTCTPDISFPVPDIHLCYSAFSANTIHTDRGSVTIRNPSHHLDPTFHKTRWRGATGTPRPFTASVFTSLVNRNHNRLAEEEGKHRDRMSIRQLSIGHLSFSTIYGGGW